jgi:methylmalonyl-CoA/ethylmalonyl-CoA epimerase
VVIRVRDLEEARRRYSALLGVTPRTIPEEAFQAPGEVAGIRFELDGMFLQVVAPLRTDGALASTIDKRGEGVSQLSFWVDDLDAEVAGFRAEGVQFTFEEPRDLPLGRVMFGHPKSLNGVVWELEEHTDLAAGGDGHKTE